MAMTVDDVYQGASRTGKWRQALVMTCVLEVSGDVIKPREKSERDDLDYKLMVLMPYKETDLYVESIVKQLETNIAKFDSCEHR